ncbi:hypothetical protein ASC95_07365 [Pelomonas sp. Root1217]|uniref:hypothetical protein n=1 Tax=unclassified Roseateles TaxID=2626991 RepID=UPI0006F5D772|nr:MULTISPECIES: hypothetical protein [unclassified Roseateles]KQV52637.1 hypothetical protein ASC95_07365 [Pelomonas sp. Root1217]KQV96025.1 hypothetical protein ASC91_00205 [Pelomonas sp. Root1237]
MKPIVTLAAMALLLSGCTSFKSFTAFEAATPPDYSGPTVNVADQVTAISPQRLHVFEMTEVDGRRLSSSSMASARAGQGNAMTLAPVALTNELPPQSARVRLQAATQYASPLVAMSNPSCRTVGDVSFTPQDGKRYTVAGHIAADRCEVWIEEMATGQVVTEKLTGPGTER